MIQIPIQNLTAEGELRARMLKNFARLHGPEYLPGATGLAPYASEGWPGDWEGRTILALSLHAQALGTHAAYLDEIVRWTESLLNADGYRGEKLDKTRINEQQHAAHSWLMRGLIEYHRLTGEEWVLIWLNRIVDGLYLPILPHLCNYPQKPSDRRRFEAGQAAGALADTYNEWRLSSDIGCLFIALDGLTSVYEYAKREDLLPLIEGMIRLFTAQDFARDTLQTHACLTGMRGVMRAYRLTGRGEYLDAVTRFFEIYKRYGMSEWFANFDWFSTPSWSEPCGVIDSYMLALELFTETGREGYLNDAMHIWYNGVLGDQRPNGGFGCDSCAEDGWVHATNFYEAYWCCTMRGGEGLGVPIRYAILKDENALVLPLYTDGTFALGNGVVLRERTRMPDAGETRLTLIKGELACPMRLFVPEFAGAIEIRINGEALAFTVEAGFARFDARMRAGDTLLFAFDTPVRMLPTVGNLHAGDQLYTIRKGPLVLVTESGLMKPLRETDFAVGATGKIEARGRVFETLHNNYLRGEAELKIVRRQLLFRKA